MYSLDWLEHDKWVEYVSRVWLPPLMDDAMQALPSQDFLDWELARAHAEARYPTRKQWLALKPSPGQSYQLFSFPHPRPEQ